MAGVIDRDEATRRFMAVGSGSGYGYGYVDGSGSGSGYGDGDGSGYGDGYGSGDGYGDGSGDGYGDGSGITSFNGEAVNMIDGIATILRSIHGDVAAGAILRNDLTLTKCYVVKGSGYFAHGDTLQAAQAALEAKILDGMPTEERIAEFIARFRPGKKYPARLYYDWHHILTGSCEMGRDEFARAHGYDLDRDELTPEEFMELTKDAYGGSVIRELMEAWRERGE